MTNVLNFQGFIREVTYKAYLVGELNCYHFSEFDVNTASPYGVIVFDDGEIAYSKWVSPKRTRTSTTGVQVHPQIQLKQYIENVKRDFEQFKRMF